MITREAVSLLALNFAADGDLRNNPSPLAG
jgi:hypothetical protein